MTAFGPKPMACRRCRRVLDHITTDEGVTWIHTVQDAATADHEPDAAPYEEVDVLPRCDFCNADTPDMERWVLPVRDYRVAPMHMNDGSFSMCPDCHAVYSPVDFGPIAQRVLDAFLSRGEFVDPRAIVLSLSQTWQNIIALPYREVDSAAS